MIRFGDVNRIMCLGAHCDDIEIGCATTLLQLAEIYPEATVHWVVLSSDETREKETRAAGALLTRSFARTDYEIARFRNGYFPHIATEIKDFFESLKESEKPDLIFTHYRQDRHQDHRTVCELTWNTFRSHDILEYEIPKWDPDLANPNLLIASTRTLAQRKAEIIYASFVSQQHKHWFSEESFLALQRLRGIQAGYEYAEGFFSPKLVIDLRMATGRA